MNGRLVRVFYGQRTQGCDSPLVWVLSVLPLSYLYFPIYYFFLFIFWACHLFICLFVPPCLSCHFYYLSVSYFSTLHFLFLLSLIFLHDSALFCLTFFSLFPLDLFRHPLFFSYYFFFFACGEEGKGTLHYVSLCVCFFFFAICCFCLPNLIHGSPRKTLHPFFHGVKYDLLYYFCPLH